VLSTLMIKSTNSDGDSPEIDSRQGRAKWGGGIHCSVDAAKTICTVTKTVKTRTLGDWGAMMCFLIFTHFRVQWPAAGCRTLRIMAFYKN
jgi:hypothetical protein